MHDRLASTISLARMLLQAIGPDEIELKVNSASLRLVLETLIDVGGVAPSPLPHIKPRVDTNNVMRRSVAGHLATYETDVENLPEHDGNARI